VRHFREEILETGVERNIGLWRKGFNIKYRGFKYIYIYILITVFVENSGLPGLDNLTRTPKQWARITPGENRLKELVGDLLQCHFAHLNPYKK